MASWCEAPACGARPVAGLRQIAARPGKEYFACASAHQRRCPWTKGPDLQADCAFRTAQLPGVSVRIDAEDVSSRPARVGRSRPARLPYRKRRARLRRLLDDTRAPLLVMPASRELTGARAWMLHVAAGVEGVVVKHPLIRDRPGAFVPTRTLYPEEPQIRPLRFGRDAALSASGLPPRATLRLPLNLDSRSRNAQRGRGCVGSVFVGLADICGDTTAGGHLEAVGSCPLPDLSGFSAVRGRTCGRRAPSTG